MNLEDTLDYIIELSIELSSDVKLLKERINKIESDLQYSLIEIDRKIDKINSDQSLS